MQKLTINGLKFAAIATVLSVTSACSTVSPEQLSAVEAKATSAMSEARSASSAAANALKTAQAAQETATAAQAEAAAARSTADAAMACCTGNKDRIERMFEQMMKK